MNDLVTKLRSRAWEDRQHRQLRELAAKRIEALEAALRCANSWLAHYGHGVVEFPITPSASETPAKSWKDREPPHCASCSCGMEAGIEIPSQAAVIRDNGDPR